MEARKILIGRVSRNSFILRLLVEVAL